MRAVGKKLHDKTCKLCCKNFGAPYFPFAKMDFRLSCLQRYDGYYRHFQFLQNVTGCHVSFVEQVIMKAPEFFANGMNATCI